MTLASLVLNGDRLALARLLTQVENGTPEGFAELDILFSHTGKAHLIGVTGAPGTGKSSLVNQIAYQFRHPVSGSPTKVAIIAVDPSSPFTGGAVLGDRVRMRDLTGDSGVFIRSMASRGSLGGLARATAGVVQVFDAAGYDVVLIETVGAGQSEVDIARLAHTTIVVEAPGFGDEIQAIKAGILEIADILVINKADLPGAENTERVLKAMLNLAHPVNKVFKHHGSYISDGIPESETDDAIWIPPILQTVASERKGIAELVTAIAQHAGYLHQSGNRSQREKDRLEVEFDAIMTEALVARFRAGIPESRYDEVMEQLFLRKISPWKAASMLLEYFKRGNIL
jgi:LAO/AO transport system kinase